MAIFVFFKIIIENALMEVIESSQKQKANIPQKIKLEKRKIIFRRAITFL